MFDKPPKEYNSLVEEKHTDDVQCTCVHAPMSMTTRTTTLVSFRTQPIYAKWARARTRALQMDMWTSRILQIGYARKKVKEKHEIERKKNEFKQNAAVYVYTFAASLGHGHGHTAALSWRTRKTTCPLFSSLFFIFISGDTQRIRYKDHVVLVAYSFHFIHR